MSHALTLVITRDVDNRYRGLLRSTMVEVAAGIYVSPQINRDARERLWDVVERWHAALRRGCIIMIWRDTDASGHIGVRAVGETTRDLCDADGFILTRLKKR